RIRPLERSALDMLVANRYRLEPGAGAHLGDYLEERSQGNPLFAVELLRSLEDERVLERTGDGWRLGELAGLEVPSLLQTMIEARIARLPEQAARGLHTAAIIGQEIALDLWQQVLAISDDALLEVIEALV